MRYVSINDAKPGMKLAYDLFDLQGRIVVGANKALTETIITRLDQYGFSGMYIDDEITGDIEIQPVISPELRETGMACVKENDIDQCIAVARNIVDEVIKNGAIRLDMLDLRTYDDYTYAHSVNVAVLCCLVGLCIELSLEDLESLVIAALIHDLGKREIDASILYKQERLTPEEYQVMKSHVIRSYELIADRMDISTQVKSTVLGHHENVDGSGYPHGLTSNEQTLLMKIIHVVDVYDALTTRRPYKKPYSPAEAMEYLMGGCGTLFDIEVVRRFMQCVPLYPKGTEVRLSDGRTAVVLENSNLHNLRPIVRTTEEIEEIDLLHREHYMLTIVGLDEEKIDSPAVQEHGRRKMIAIKQRPFLLIVDPSIENQNELIRILSKKFDIATSDTGANALEYLKRGRCPDIILMEQNMPQMDGIETLNKAREMVGENLRVLFTTDKCDLVSIRRFLGNRANGYLIRPYRPVFVKSEVERIINGWSEFC